MSRLHVYYTKKALSLNTKCSIWLLFQYKVSTTKSPSGVLISLEIPADIGVQW